MNRCRFQNLTLLILLFFFAGCATATARSGSGPKIGERPTVTPTRTARPTRAVILIPLATPISETTPTPAETSIAAVEPNETPTATNQPPSPTPSPTPPFESVRYTSESLQIEFELPQSWVIDSDSEADGILQIADTTETLYAGSVRKGALITITGMPNIAENLTEWIAAVTSAIKENYLLDDSQTSLTVPFEINGYSGLRVEQRGGYTVTDPPEAVTLMIVAIEHNDWLVTIATGARNDQLELVEAQFDHLIRTLNIMATDPEAGDQ